MKLDVKILIVEDELLLQLMLTHMLKKMGFSNFKTTRKGSEAVEMAKAENFDLILMDLMLKGRIDGIEAYRQIKEKRGEIPVIYITGNMDPKNKERAAITGYHAYLGKPVDQSELKEAIARLFSAKE